MKIDDATTKAGRDWEGEYRCLAHALVGDTGASAIMEAEAHASMRRAADVLKAFPLPSQGEGITENYRRILNWLYGTPDAAALIIELEFGANGETNDG